MAAAPTVGGIFGRYRIVEQLGQGGMGVVFRAFDVELQRYVALKFTTGIVDETRRRRFRDEALALARLNHPHIGVVHGFETINGVDVLVMEYIAGHTLAEKISGAPIPESSVVSVGLQLAGALREAHAGGVIHRDLKPSNILISEDGDAKVLDFGLALLRSGTSPTQSAVKLEGTVQYIAPEVLRGGIPDERSDIYSLGAVLYEMATGRPPHASESFGQLVESILYKSPVPPEQIVPSLSASIVGIIKHALEPLPTNRYQSAAELRADLVRLQTRTALDIPNTFAKYRRRKQLIVAVALTVIAAVLLWIGGRVHIAGLLPEKKVIAVLPFEPIGEGAENRALSRGLTELITVRLAQASQRYGFEVVPASEIRSQEITSAEQARQKLGANLVVEGTWDFSAEHRIMYSLVDAQKRRNLNAAVVRADTSDIYSAESDVLQQLLGMLDVEFGQTTSTQPAQPEAYQSYVRGRGYLWDYQNSQSLDRAIAMFQSAVDRDPKFAQAYASMGEAYWRKYEDSKDPKFVEEAVAACNRAASLNRNISELHSTFGLINQGTGKFAEAVTSFQEALRLDPSNDTASRGVAATYEKLGDYARAESAFRRAIAARSDYWGGYHDLGLFFYRRGQFEAAGREFQHEITLAPENVRAYTDLGGVYYMQNRLEEARQLFLKSIKIQPNFRAYSNLGTIDFFQQKYNSAARNFEQAITFNDKDGRVWRNLAWSYYWGGQNKNAMDAFRRAEKSFEEQLRIYPHDPAAMIALADCYSVTGEKQKAESLLAKALTSSTDAESAFRAVEIYEKLGNRGKALNWLKTAVQHGYVIAEIEKDPSLSQLRTDPRYSKAIQQPK